jgi:2-polyprenyl-3-methyl-5-hydroxy-6-metoxy-1,4-benzoquinol methylase
MKKIKKNINHLMSGKCILCQSSETSVLLKREQYLMARCKKCGLIFRLPKVEKDQYLRDIQKYYLEVDPYYRVAHSRQRLYERFLYKIRHARRKDARLLDVGCGFGYFLSLARNNGWDIWGLEPNSDLIRIGIKNYGLDIQCAEFEKSNLSENYFDVITLWNVFEELNNPKESIIEIKRILKPSGLLFIRTPNATFHLFIYRIQQMLKKICLDYILPYQSFIFHNFNFSKKSLEWELSTHNFSHIKIKNSLPTSKDPYAMGRAVGILKIFAFLVAQFLFFLTWGKLTVAPSIEVFAENEKD